MEHVFENVRILVATDPSQRIKLEQPVGDVGKKVANSKVRISSAISTSRSCCCSTAAISRVLSSVDAFASEVKANTIDCWITGLLQ